MPDSLETLRAEAQEIYDKNFPTLRIRTLQVLGRDLNAEENNASLDEHIWGQMSGLTIKAMAEAPKIITNHPLASEVLTLSAGSTAEEVVVSLMVGLVRVPDFADVFAQLVAGPKTQA